MPQNNKIKIRRGLNAALPASNTEVGELRYSTDTKELYIDDGTTNVKIGGDPTGFPVSTATQTALDGKFTQRTITGTTNQITVTNGDGVSGNPTLSLPQDIHTGASPTFVTPIATSEIVLNKQTSTVYSSGLTINKRGTTGDANAAVTDGSEVGYHTFGAWDGSAYKRLAFVFVEAKGDTSSATAGGRYAISTRNSTTGVEGYRIYIDHTGLYPTNDSTYTNGTSSLYWSSTYTDRLYLNSTAYADGATAGQIKITGLLMPVQATTAGAPAYVKGAMYFDTTLNKLRIGGATAWETVTSV